MESNNEKNYVFKELELLTLKKIDLLSVHRAY